MHKRVVGFLLVGACCMILSGCVTARKKTVAENQELKGQVSSLESQLQSKNEEINNLRDAVTQLQDAKAACELTTQTRSVEEVKSRPNTRQIQTALKNAGYNPGVIDGKRGRQTRDAIKAFQAANNLQPDGKVGSKTWGLLKDYLYQKSK